VATDYDAPRRGDVDELNEDSLEELKARRAEAQSGSIDVDEGRTRVELLLTSGWCPFASRMLSEARQALEAMPSSGDVVIEVVWDEPWTMDRLSAEARSKLRFLPDPVAVADRDRYLQQQMDRDRPPLEVTTDDR